MTAGCEDCFFKSPKCGNKGDPDSPFVIVGESPGIMEVHKGVPFVGNSGKIVHEVLTRMGLPDGFQPYFTNAIQCLPRNKDPERLASACVACRGRLLADIRRVPRKVILALGNGALWSTTGYFDLKVTKERGKIFNSELAEFGVLAAVHPAFLLRGGGNLQQFERDIKYAIDLATKPNAKYLLPHGSTYHVIESDEEADDICSEVLRLGEDDYIASDIETTGFSHIADDILCQGIQYNKDQIYVVPSKYMRPQMFQTKASWVWHNGKFDIKFLRYEWPEYDTDFRVDEDTMLLSYTLNERRGIHDLDQVAMDWLGSPNHKSMVDQYTKGTIIDPQTGLKRKRHYGDIPQDILYKYLALDIADTFQLFPILREKVRADKWCELEYAKTLIPGGEYLSRIEERGMLPDMEWIDSNHKRYMGDPSAPKETPEYEGIIPRLRREFNEQAIEDGYMNEGDKINLNSWQQLKPYIYGYLKLAPESWGTDADTIKKVKENNPHKALNILSDHRKAAKLWGTYVKGTRNAIDGDGRVHTTYKLHGTATGRLASSDPLNVQNVPRDPTIRGQYRATPGFIILEVDYSQAELRSLAQLSKCEALSEVFLSGQDLHVELTVFLFGEKWTKEDKMKAKTVNFGIPYGREAPSIAEAFDVSVSEAQSWIDGWAKRFPGAWEFIEKCREAPVKGQTIITPFGNKKRPGVVARENIKDLQNESANFPHQNVASNLTLHSGIKIQPWLKRKHGGYIINTVHDCLVTEIPFDISNHEKEQQKILKIARYMQDVMEEEPKLWGLKRIPFKAEPEIGWRWGNVAKLDEIAEKYNNRFIDIPQYIEAH